MDRFQLATLAKWAGDEGLRGRKRLQKVVFFLKRAGCPFDADFALHLYGPYSKDVADACDDMVAAGLLEQFTESTAGGNQYRYRLPERTRSLLARSEQTYVDRKTALDPYRECAKELLERDNWELELGSTILYFHSDLHDWDAALKQACEFKKTVPEADATRNALELARRFAGPC